MVIGLSSENVQRIGFVSLVLKPYPGGFWPKAGDA
jgi:hypothetical protein